MPILLFLIILLFSFPTQALTCGEVPSCESLGFSTEDDATCADNGYMYCPFDKTYKKCVVKGGINCKDHTLKECPEGATDCTLCGRGKLTELVYKVDGCKEGYKLENDTCVAEVVATACEVGDVYYLDKTCGKADDFDGSKTPIGVVFYVNEDRSGGKIVNLKDLTLDSTTYTFDPENPYNVGYKYLFFGLRGKDIPGITNYSSASSLLTAFQNGNADLYDGKTNTALIAEVEFNDSYTNCKNGTYTENTRNYAKYCVPTAANAALAFYPVPQAKGTDVGEGNWYLPAIGELAQLYGIDVSQMTSGTGTTGATGDVKTTVNATLAALGSTYASKLTDDYYWSSSEYSSNASCILYMTNGNRGNSGKYGSGYVRVILAF